MQPTILVLAAVCAVASGLNYCEYYAALGIQKEGCPPLRQITSAKPKTRPTVRQCVLKFYDQTCKKSALCDSKKVTGEPCCAPAPGTCPTIEQLDVACVRSNHTNWCTVDAHCYNNGKCCPTGCGYNICT